MTADCVQGQGLDRHWGWMIVGGGFLCSCFTFGIFRSSGMFYTEWFDYFEEGSAMTSLVGMANILVLSLSAPVCATLATRFGTRPVVMIGGLVTSSGFMISAFTPNIYVLFLSYGLFVGLGTSLAINAMSTVMVYAVPKKQALASGLSMAGTCVGGSLLPILLQVLIDNYSWRGAFIVMSGLTLHICVSGALVLPGSLWPATANQLTFLEDGSDLECQDVSGSTKPHQEETMDTKAILGRLCKNSSLILYYIQTFFTCFAAGITLTHLKSAIMEFGDVTAENATYGIACINGGNLIATIVVGVLQNKYPRMEPLIVLIVISLSAGTFAFILPSLRSYIGMLTICAFIGACYIGVSSQCLLILKNLVGSNQDYRLAFGLWTTTVGFASVIGPFFAGFIYDSTSDYTSSFYIAGTADLVGVLFLSKSFIELVKNSQSTLEMEGSTKENQGTENAPSAGEALLANGKEASDADASKH